MANSTPPNSMNGTINPDIAKSAGVGTEATKPPLVENHCSTWSSMSLTLACYSVTQLCLTLCNPMDCSTPCLSVHHQLLEFTQTHVHWISDAIQPSHPLLAPFPPAFNLSQHQSLHQWVGSSHHVAKILELQLNSCSYVFNYQLCMWIQTISQMWLQFRPLSQVWPYLLSCKIRSWSSHTCLKPTHSKLNLLIPGPLKAASSLGPQSQKQHQKPGSHPLLPSFLSTSTSLPPTRPSNPLLSPVASNFWLPLHPSTASHSQCPLSSKPGNINPSDVFLRIIVIPLLFMTL